TFFFQAEDGIRDATVTGVQTCALPICPRAGGPPQQETDGNWVLAAAFSGRSRANSPGLARSADSPRSQDGLARKLARQFGNHLRSEERRVGKEGRAERTPWPYTKTHAG